jgi:hypothetical protein
MPRPKQAKPPAPPNFKTLTVTVTEQTLDDLDRLALIYAANSEVPNRSMTVRKAIREALMRAVAKKGGNGV